jgi:parallel beta-helix repeat protein
MKKITNILLASMLFITIIFNFQPIYICSASSTLKVKASGGENYTTITSALNDASPGDTIYVYSGTYSENLVIDKSIILTGENRQNTIITGSASGDIIKIISDNVRISGFTIKDSVGTDMKCLKLLEVNNCVISNNIIQNGNDGIFMSKSNNNIIKENTIENTEGCGIFAYMSNNDNEICKNVIRNNNVRGIFLHSDSNNNILYLNDFSSNTIGNAKDEGDNTWYKGNQGNYWDDYNDYDSNNDGIGDNPYTKGGVNDQKPLGYFIYEDATAFITSITPNPVEEGQTISFSGYGTPSYRITNYQWKAGSTIIGTSAQITYSSLSPGTYTISFRVKDTDEKWSTADTRTLIVTASNSGEQSNQKPTATIQSITPSTTTFGTNVSFSGYGTDSDGIITMYNWSSNIDGYLSESPSFTTNDLSIGAHTITFKVKDNQGLWSNPVQRTLTINKASIENNEPVAINNGPYNSYLNHTITFDASESYDNDGTIIKYKWDFGDGNTKEGKTVTHTYTEENQYIVTLTITDNLGAQDTKTTTATIITQPDEQQNNGETENDKWVIPGFEAITAFLALTIIVVIKKKKQR